MDALTQKIVQTPFGEKTISVHAQDITLLKEPIDIMTVSAFFRSYEPTPKTMMRALYCKNISVTKLSLDPEIDLREVCNIWLSREIRNGSLPVRRVGCIEMSQYVWGHSLWRDREAQIIASIRAYFAMLHIASLAGIPCETISLPILGGGSQQISMDLITTPLINECVKLLKTNEHVKRILIITINQSQAFRFASALEKSYSVKLEDFADIRTQSVSPGKRTAFISYSSKDKNVADNLCAKLEASGTKVWYAPRDIVSADYASAIVRAITRCTHFIVILSRSSLRSPHVLNEIDLAFRELYRNIIFLPLKIDEEELGPAFLYYLSRQHWMDAHLPPLEKRLDEFVSKIGGE